MVSLRGLKGWLLFIGIILGLIIVLIFILGLFVVLVPVLIGLVLVGILLGWWKMRRKDEKEYMNIKFKIKE